ncbi:20270_t:CDS:1, partial [Gigaspora rosea]
SIFAYSNTEDTNNSEMPNHIEFLNNFFHEIESDIKQNEQLLLAFEKFQKGYCAAKNISKNKLVSFVYQHANSPVMIRSSTKIPVQVASVQRRKGAALHSTKKESFRKKTIR